MKKEIYELKLSPMRWIKQYKRHLWTIIFLFALGTIDSGLFHMVTFKPPVVLSVIVFTLDLLILDFLIIALMIRIDNMMLAEINRLKQENDLLSSITTSMTKMEDEMLSSLKDQSGRTEIDNNPITIMSALIDVNEKQEDAENENNLLKAVAEGNLTLAQEYLRRFFYGGEF